MSRNSTAPKTALRARFCRLPLLMRVPPIKSDARAMVTMPLPMSMLADFWHWASRHPDRAVMPPEMMRVTVVVKVGSMEEERTMSALLPVARMESPSRVLRNTTKKPQMMSTKTRAVMSLYWPSRCSGSSRERMPVNTVSTLFRFTRELPPMTAMLMEYSPVFTAMPASSELTPMRVCKKAVTNPEHMPAKMAAGRESTGCPAAATTAPTAAPRVKHPSVDKSHTFSIP